MERVSFYFIFAKKGQRESKTWPEAMVLLGLSPALERQRLDSGSLRNMV